jgi:hypothetical protein
LLEPYSTLVEFTSEEAQTLLFPTLPSAVEMSKSSTNTTHLLETATAPSISREAIVDGPSLAYHVYHIAKCRVASSTRSKQNATADATNGVDATPSYAFILAILARWLGMLERYGLPIKAIFFDGALPTEKRPERLRRLQGQSTSIASFKRRSSSWESAIVNVVHSPGEADGLQDADLFGNMMPKYGSSAPSFLVPAVLEHLRNSQWSGVTRLVPNEADEYCSSFVRHHGGIVFSADSDYLGLELGLGGFIFLDNLELDSSDSTKPVLRARMYEAKQIAERLRLESLIFLDRVFEDGAEPNLRSMPSTATTISRAQKLREMMKSDARIRQKYQRELDKAKTHNPVARGIGHYPRRLEPVLQELDPRIAEWLLPAVSGIATNEGDVEPIGVTDMHLPVLLEDPDRAAPFGVVGVKVRRIAYSLLVKETRIHEYFRKGSGVQGQYICPFVDGELDAAVKGLCEEYFAQTRSWVTLPNLTWREFALVCLCHDIREHQSHLPSRAELEAVYALSGAASWPSLHLAAQYQAVLYSWRLLAQCLVAANAIHKRRLSSVVSRLQDEVASLSGSAITDMFDAISEGSRDSQKRFLSLITEILAHFGIGERETRRRKRGRRGNESKHAARSVQRGQTSQTGGLSQNRYDALLAMDS